MSLIEFRGVKKAFGSKVVYRDLSLSIEEGESITIIGGSGQGKSVMLKLLIGLLRPDGGEIFFDGERIDELSEREYAKVRRRISMLFQGGALFDSLSVRDNVAYGLHEHHPEMSQEALDERIDESLEAVGLADIRAMWPAGLSGGMKKRVGLARAIAIRPDILLYDEPTTGLDPVNVTRINELIIDLKQRLDVTSIVVTHDMESAFLVSDRMAMIHGGGVVFTGTPADFLEAEEPIVRDFIHGYAPESEDVETLLRTGG